MFNSLVLDVVIGLVFIYLLYSLLITILGEIVMEKLGIRARTLRKAIEKMLNDGYPSKPTTTGGKIRQEFQEFFLLEHEEFPHSFAGRFYDQPSIKYLTKSQGRLFSWLPNHGKPSYFSARNFSETLIHIFRNAGTGTTDMQKIQFCLANNTLRLQEETLDHFNDMERDAGGDLEKFKTKLEEWFNETMDRASGWYKSKLRIVLFLLGFLLAVAFNVDTFKIVSLLSRDEAARDQLVKMSTEFVKDTSHIKDFIYANGDTIRRESLYDSAYARVSKDMNEANMILGIGWNYNKATVIERDTLFAKRDGTIYGAVFNSIIQHRAEAMLEEKANESVEWIDSVIAAKDSMLRVLIRDTLNTRYRIIDSTKQSDSLKLDSQKREIAKLRASIQVLMLQRQADSLVYAKADHKLKEACAVFYEQHKKAKRKVTMIDSVQYDTTLQEKSRIIIYGKRPYSGCEITRHFICAAFNPFSKSFWGFVITALALSLGAPFWFDLLKKLISIRGGGVKPEEKANDPTSGSPVPPVTIINGNSAATPPPPPPAPVTTVSNTLIALRMYGETIRREKGVVNVAAGHMLDNGRKKECIQVNVEDKRAAVTIAGKYPELTVAPNVFVPVDIRITGYPKPSSGGADTTGGIDAKQIFNSATPGNKGSFCCIVRERYQAENKFLLTCYHVLNADKSFNTPAVKTNIKGMNNRSIGTRYKGYMNTHHDTGLVSIAKEDMAIYTRDMDGVEYPVASRSVEDDEVYITEVAVNGFKSRTTGMIVHTAWKEKFHYALQQYTQEIKDMIAIKYEGNYEAQFGNSGAVVVDKENKAIGMVVGVDRVHIYAVKIDTILNELGLDFESRQSQT